MICIFIFSCNADPTPFFLFCFFVFAWVCSFIASICNNFSKYESLRSHLILLFLLHLSSVLVDDPGQNLCLPSCRTNYTQCISLTTCPVFTSSSSSPLSTGPCLSVYFVYLSLRLCVLVPDDLKPPKTTGPWLKR